MNRPSRVRRALRGIGFGAFTAYVFAPQLAIWVLVGIAVSWWLAGAIAGGALFAAAGAYAASRSRGVMGRVLGTTDYDPLDYAQWTRYLVVRPIVVSLPAGLFVSLAAVVTVAFGAPLSVVIVVMVVSGLLGFAVGGWWWLDMEEERELEPRARRRG